MPFRTTGGIAVPAIAAEQVREVDRVAARNFEPPSMEGYWVQLIEGDE